MGQTESYYDSKLDLDTDGSIYAGQDRTGQGATALGPRHGIGEGSIALHRALGHETIVNGRLRNVGIDRGVITIVFPHSGDGAPQTPERIQTLGGVCLAMAPDVAETTLIPRPPKGREAAPIQISRLLHAHEIVIKEARAMARRAAESADDGTNDLLVSEVIRRNEQQAWFLAEHVVDVPLVRA